MTVTDVSRTTARPKVLLAGILLAVVVVPTGVSGTGVALPHIAADLSSSPAMLQWVVNGFNLTFAVFSLVAGSVADHLGRRRGLIVGALLFFGSAVLSALAPTLLILDIGRALAGIGAAIIFACSGALLAITFDGAAAARAFALFGTAAGVGLGLGPTISSTAISLVGWPGIFWFNAAAIAASGLLVVLSGVHDTPAHDAGKLDYRGAIAFAVSLTLVIAAVVQADSWGWGSAATLGTLAAGIALFAVFIRIQWTGDHPLLDIGLLRSPRLVGLLLVPVAGAVGFVTLLTYYPTFLNTVWQLSAGETGLVMLLMTVPVILAPLVAGALHTRGVPVWIILGGSALFFVAGAALLTTAGTDRDILALVVPFLLLGTGFGLGVGLVDGQAIGSVPPERSGMVSGLVSTVRLGSEALVVAAFASALTTGVGAQVRSQLPDSLDPAARDTVVDQVVTGEIGSVDPSLNAELLRNSFSDGLIPLLWALAVISLVLAVAITVLLRRPAATAPSAPQGSADVPAEPNLDPVEPIAPLPAASTEEIRR
ncbi:MFS transporter [Rhodococcus triatomae]|uniref:Major Facilitator Superfamily protein n=1 Tax=Rhodococcus triatomae TaxID=300028 RepID=A0A1G8LDD6_9NOCA|nr:MFS transporter [Rhodococcus triatomae]QNG20564.1 MFS transporter [Rhodococcus triatomae]QNG23518.1 MFS transporter [Rhodococcus triatomae]SDI53636.1 Major Facilitator Superfamily protein [Rhodococcus triatomae]